MLIELSRIQVRKLPLTELGCLIDYRMAYLTEMQGSKSQEYQDRLRSELSAFFTAEMNAGRFVAYLAEYDEMPIGFGAMVLKNIPGDFTQSSYLEADVLNMYTIPEARKQGVSGLILDRLIQEAKQLGISKLSLHTSIDGEKLYRKFGFNEPVFPVLELGLIK